MRVQRLNSGRQALRRYRHPSGAIVIVRADRRAAVIPASMPTGGVTVDVPRATAARLIRDARHSLKQESYNG
jgi:hypothetical protein